jgi:hypothetical protein
MSYKKEDFNHMASLRRRAMVLIAQELGQEHNITKLMGSMSYGRNDAEQGPGENLKTAIREMAFLDGCFCVLNTWAAINDKAAQSKMLKIYPRGYTKVAWVKN